LSKDGYRPVVVNVVEDGKSPFAALAVESPSLRMISAFWEPGLAFCAATREDAAA
jgi:hypothetical protein